MGNKSQVVSVSFHQVWDGVVSLVGSKEKAVAIFNAYISGLIHYEGTTLEGLIVKEMGEEFELSASLFYTKHADVLYHLEYMVRQIQQDNIIFTWWIKDFVLMVDCSY